MGAKKKPLDTQATGDAEIDGAKVGGDGSQVACGNFHDPPQKEAGQIIEDEDTDGDGREDRRLARGKEADLA